MFRTAVAFAVIGAALVLPGGAPTAAESTDANPWFTSGDYTINLSNIDYFDTTGPALAMSGHPDVLKAEWPGLADQLASAEAIGFFKAGTQYINMANVSVIQASAGQTVTLVFADGRKENLSGDAAKAILAKK